MEDGKRKYARVLLVIGIGLKAGQSLLIEAPTEQEEFAALLAQEAYALGCADVGILWRSNRMKEARLAANIAYHFADAELLAKYYAEQGAAYLRLDSVDLNAFPNATPEELNGMAQEDAKPRELFRRIAAGCGQTLACVPSISWANAVYPELPENERLNKLWETVLQCVRCEAEDPIREWNDYIDKTASKKEQLDAKGYTTFHYYDGRGTDLIVSPAQGDFWKGSCIRTKERVSVPNIPTEEVFLTPHKYKVNGTVRSTLPLNYRGVLIENIELEFSDGRIVKHYAEKGRDVLAAIIGTDEGSHYLGEMAFVDQTTPIAQTGRVFYTTLFDENASCHFAIGNALGPIRDPDERERRGMNTSRIHVDFMIGSEFLNVDGQLPDGTWEPVLRNGCWA